MKRLAIILGSFAALVAFLYGSVLVWRWLTLTTIEVPADHRIF
jgi:hypothetical protein